MLHLFESFNPGLFISSVFSQKIVMTNRRYNIILTFFTIVIILVPSSIVFFRSNLRIDNKSDENHSMPGANITTADIVDETELNNAIRLSAQYLINVCGESGKFTYKINLNPNVNFKSKYNILRHAGSIYSLAMYEKYYPSGNAQEAIKRAANFLKRESVSPVDSKDDLLAAWSYPELSGNNKPVHAKLGGTGLTLVALVSVENIFPKTTSIDTLRKLAEFLIFMQKEDGEFYSKFIPSEGGKSDRWKSLYYPGEAALGLLMLYEIDPSPKWLKAAADGIAYLAHIRREKINVESDHWALLATEILLKYSDKIENPVPKKEYQNHAVQICKSILNSKAYLPKESILFGSFTDDGRTTPTATRLEGLLSALNYLPSDNKLLMEEIKLAVNQGIIFLLRSQITSGKYGGAIPRALQPLPIDYHRYTKSFNERATEVRIDYVQHALSAMIQYEQRFSKATKKP